MDYARFIFGEPAADDNDEEMDFATSSSEDGDGEPEFPSHGPPLITRPMEDVSRHPVKSEDSGRSTTPESNPPELVFFPFPRLLFCPRRRVRAGGWSTLADL